MMNKKTIQKNKAFVLLFAVVISSIILAIALGVANISLKEINFGTSARDANDAFFAADTGAECALYYDRSDNSAFIETSPAPVISCAGITPITPIIVSMDNDNTCNYLSAWSFLVSNLGSSKKACADVVVGKGVELADHITPCTKIISIGQSNCNAPNRVERELDVTY